jgi:hypothetical protein
MAPLLWQSSPSAQGEQEVQRVCLIVHSRAEHLQADWTLHYVVTSPKNRRSGRQVLTRYGNVVDNLPSGMDGLSSFTYAWHI